MARPHWAPLGGTRPGRASLGGAGLGSAWLGTGGWSAAGFDSRPPALPAGHGTAGLGPAALGWARLRVARTGWAREMGDWQPLGFEALAPTHGTARRVMARQVCARLGPVRSVGARLGVARPGEETAGDWQAPEFEPPAPTYEARRGTAGSVKAGRGQAGHGKDGWTVSSAVRLRTTCSPQGRARLGTAGRCLARCGWPRRGMAGGWSSPGFDSPEPTRGWSWLRKAMRGEARRCSAWRGLVRRCEVRQGGRVAHTEVRVLGAHAWRGAVRRGLSGQGELGRGLAWPGIGRVGTHPGSSPGRPRKARQGPAWQCEASRGMAWQVAARLGSGVAWPCSAGRGVAPQGCLGVSGVRVLGIPLLVAGRGSARPGRAGPVSARRCWAGQGTTSGGVSSVSAQE